MKRLLVMILFVILLTGCGERTDSLDSPKSSMFVCIQGSDYNNDYRIVYHRDTKVMYAISDGANNHGTFTLLVNSDGTPMLYEAECEEN